MHQRVRKAFLDAIDGSDAEKDADGQVTVHGFTHLAFTTKIPAEGRSASGDIEAVNEGS